MAGRCGCGSSTCSCLLRAGANVHIEGTGSPSNPYTISVPISADGGNGLSAHTDGLFAASGGGGCTEVTLSEVITLRNASGLDPCMTYVVTDWSTGPGTSLPGPNRMYVTATDVNKLSTFVRLQTPLMAPGVGDVGPNRGVYLWDLGLMVEVWDALGNHVRDLGAGTSIADFPWGNLAVSNCDLDQFAFIGGYAAVSALIGASALIMANFRAESSSLDISAGGATLIELLNAEVLGCQLLADTGSTLIVASTKMFGAQVTMTNASTANITNSHINGGGYVANNGGLMTFQDCTFQQNGFFTNSGPGEILALNSEFYGVCTVFKTSGATSADRLVFNTAKCRDALINDTTTTQVMQIIETSVLDSTVQFQGGGGQRDLHASQILATSEVDIISAGGSPTVGMDGCMVMSHSIVTVSVGGRINYSRVSSGFTLTTGAFTHASVLADGNFTQTLTAANTNTYRGFGANTLV